MTIRLRCLFCDRDDCDGVTEIPVSWFTVQDVQELVDSLREAGLDEDFAAWQTHLGVCPECQEAELSPSDATSAVS